MVYKYSPNGNYEDFSGGRVIYHKPDYPNYPVRLAAEIFSRCLVHIKKKNDLCLYDPCCGSAYSITVLGFLFNKNINKVYCSDISTEALEITQKNLSLLSYGGIERRRNELLDLIRNYGKESHKSALCSLERIEKLMEHEIEFSTFAANILDTDETAKNNFVADIVFTDLPYGNLTDWSGNDGDEINKLLTGITPVINADTVIAISHAKNQKVPDSRFHKIEKIKIGHRKIEILKLPG